MNAVPDTSPQPPAFSHREILTAFSALMAGMLLAALDQTIVSTPLPPIVGELVGLDPLSSLVTAYLLTPPVSPPLYRHPSDLLAPQLLFSTPLLFVLAVLFLRHPPPNPVTPHASTP